MMNTVQVELGSPDKTQSVISPSLNNVMSLKKVKANKTRKPRLSNNPFKKKKRAAVEVNASAFTTSKGRNTIAHVSQDWEEVEVFSKVKRTWRKTNV